MFAQHVRQGLGKPGQKQLSCEYFYDPVGSALFDAITVLPEYGLTRADARLISRLAPVLPDHMKSPCAVVELGSGSGSKTVHILEKLANGTRLPYYPIDLSQSALAHCARELASVADVHPICGSYLDGLRRAICKRRPGQSMLLLFLGSTIGNFDRAAATEFLREVHDLLSPGDALLLGADLIKPLHRMLRAYDDPAGITSAFNKNLLARINRELDGDFVLANFAHEARWNARYRRIEMHLRALSPQRVTVRAANLTCAFAENETIWTESCHKFYADEIHELGAAAGFHTAARWIDATWPFAESLLAA